MTATATSLALLIAATVSATCPETTVFPPTKYNLAAWVEFKYPP